MEQLLITNGTKRILSLTFILTLISAFAVIFIGTALIHVNSEIKQLNIFLTNAKDIQPNFEKSLQLYTESTQEIIDYLLSLRPDSEEDFIDFISDIEKIEQKLDLTLNLQSLEDFEGTDETSLANSTTLNYSVSFYGNVANLSSFLSELEALLYYIKVDKIDFIDLAFITEKEEKQNGNISLIIKLYIRKV